MLVEGTDLEKCAKPSNTVLNQEGRHCALLYYYYY